MLNCNHGCYFSFGGDKCNVCGLSRIVNGKPRAGRCHYSIEKGDPKKRYVDSRRQCRNKTTDPSGYCHEHRVHGQGGW
jgi:hypothetical protein